MSGGSHQMVGTSPLSIRLATDTTTPSVSSASSSAFAASSDSSGERCDCQMMAWESARTLTLKRHLRERVCWRAQSLPTSDRGSRAAIPRSCRPTGPQPSPPREGARQGGRPSVSTGRRGCSRRPPRPARDRCARSLPCPDSSASSPHKGAHGMRLATPTRDRPRGSRAERAQEQSPTFSEGPSRKTARRSNESTKINVTGCKPANKAKHRKSHKAEKNKQGRKK